MRCGGQDKQGEGAHDYFTFLATYTMIRTKYWPALGISGSALRCSCQRMWMRCFCFQ